MNTYLKDELKLTLSLEKTHITHVVEEKVSYLGFNISRKSRRYTESLVSETSKGFKRRATNASIVIEMPIEKIVKKLTDYGFAKLNQKGVLRPGAKTKWIFLPEKDIILRYSAICRGLYHYYSMVDNLNQFSYILWFIKFSACFTLARKLNLSVRQVFKKFGKNFTVKDGIKSISL